MIPINCCENPRLAIEGTVLETKRVDGVLCGKVKAICVACGHESLAWGAAKVPKSCQDGRKIVKRTDDGVFAKVGQ